jgi:hypothetical protein
VPSCATRARRTRNTTSADRSGSAFTLITGSVLVLGSRKIVRRKALRLILQKTANADEQFELYRKETNASRADFFRRKSEINSGEFEGE